MSKFVILLGGPVTVNPRLRGQVEGAFIQGVGYLMTTLSKKFFPELWEARTHL